ncbi:threonine transporter RhtB [Desulfomarina profundi]|uniref:Threonine transporter RhtB n=1 Tax=Desulfomarina profundi TaxID=2772557 RepID=A0A8D5FF27_9BACT|nr:LysE family translocator [Desulfomarina profundi]BCL59506.1 threonine transporter RhtB [Desulfomarina profundi]
MEIHTFITCFTAVTLLTLTPGVDTILVIRNSGRGGWKDGAASSLGICSGLFVHATVSALGISSILLLTTWAFSLLKVMGATYLIWLGLTSLKELFRQQHHTGETTATTEKNNNYYKSFREGFFSNILNPKAIVFYMAFLPQFIDPSRPPLLQSLFIAGLHFIIGMIWLCTVSSMVDRAGTWLQTPQTNKILHGLSGSILILLGAKLLGENMNP